MASNNAWCWLHILSNSLIQQQPWSASTRTPPQPHIHTDWPWPPTMPGADCPSCQTHRCSSSLGLPVPERLPLEQSLHLTPSPWTESPGRGEDNTGCNKAGCLCCTLSRASSQNFTKLSVHTHTHMYRPFQILTIPRRHRCNSNMKNNNSDALKHENSAPNCLQDASVNHLHKLRLFCFYIVWT